MFLMLLEPSCIPTKTMDSGMAAPLRDWITSSGTAGGLTPSISMMIPAMTAMTQILHMDFNIFLGWIFAADPIFKRGGTAPYMAR